MTIEQIKYTVNPALDNFYISDQSLAHVKCVNKFGREIGIVDTYETLVIGTNAIYSYITSAEPMILSSSSTNDTNGGTGVRTVTVDGLDSDYNEISETVTINGQAGVTTNQSFLRVFRVKAKSAGTGGTNEGQIYVGTGTVTGGVPANIYGTIAPEEGQSLMAIWTVPAGHTAFVGDLTFNAFARSNATVTLGFYARDFTESNDSVFNVKQQYTNSRETYRAVFSPPLKFEEKTDFEVRAKTDTGNADCSAAFTITYIKNKT